jgi:hypothetical protein
MRRLILGAAIAAALALPASALAADRTGNGSLTEDSGPQLPFRGSSFMFDQSVTPDTFWRNTQLSPVPSYQWWMSLRPRYHITRDLSVRVREDLTVEWADAGTNNTTLSRQPIWGDLWTELVYTGIPSFAGIHTSAGLRLIWPVSLASQARSTYVTAGFTAGASRSFDLPNHAGDISAGISFAGTHAFTAYTNGVGTMGQFGCSSLDINLPSTCDYNGGPMNSAFNLLSIFTLGYNTPLRGLSVSVMYLLANSWLYAPPDATIMDRTGGTVNVPRSGDNTTMREYSWWLASVDYEVSREASLSLGYYVYRPILDPNGSYGNPFYSPGANTRIFFTVTLALDGIYQSIRGVPRSGAHASNNTRPGSMNAIAQQVRANALQNGTF